MKKNNTLLILLLVCISILSSCTSKKFLVITVDKPAPLTLPSSVHNITFVNNAVIQPYNVGHEESVMGRMQNSSISVNNDSIDYILMQSIEENLSNKDYFNSINLYEYPTRTDDAYNEIIPLNNKDVQNIANETNADVIFSIDKILISTTSNTLPADDYVADVYNVLDLKANIWYNLYDKKGNNLLQTITDGDSIFWIEAQSNHVLLSDPIPSREDAMKIGANILANRVVSVLVPYQHNEERIFYSDVKEATKLADKDEWDKAISLWIAGFNKAKNSKAKARIANNIALSYELTDNLKEALKWNQTSIDLFNEVQVTTVDIEYFETAKAYKQILLERVQDFRVLDFNDKN